MMEHRKPNSKHLTAVLKALISRVVPLNLPLIDTIHHLFVQSPSERRASLLDQESQAYVNRLMIKALRSSFPPGSAPQLLDALKNQRYSLMRLCRDIGWIPADPTIEEPLEGWNEFAELLINAANEYPQRGIAVILPFITPGSTVYERYWSEESGQLESVERPVAEFDHNAALRLFDFDRLIKLLAEMEMPADYDRETEVCFSVAQNAARAIISGGSGDEKASGNS